MRGRGSAALLACIGVAFLLGAAARSAAGHAPSFAQAKSYATGNGPVPTVADLNGDRRPDLVTANYRANTVSVLLNRGHGTLGARKDYATGREPFSVAIGDLNGDGKGDLVAQLDGGKVSVLLNSGDGSFGAKRDYRTNGLGSSLPVVADLTADGKADLVTYNEGDTVSVLLNRGDGTFEPARVYATGRGPSSLAVDDLNGDGRPDLATANTRANTVSVLVNRGDGSFAPKRDLRTARSPFSVKTRDLNGDRKLDIVTANFGGISVLRNRGGGSFGAHRDYPNCRPCFADSKPDFASTEIADLNRDGKPDVVTRNDDELEHEEYGVSRSLFLNKGNGAFKASHSYRDPPTDLPSTWFMLIDLNGDRTLDLAGDDGRFFVHLGKGDGTFESKLYYPSPWEFEPELADLNGDRKPDIVTGSGKRVWVRLNKPGLCNVQYVVGATLAAAERKLTRVNCRIGRISRVYSPIKAGRVISVKPRFGAVRPGGAKVDLVVSRGPKR